MATNKKITQLDELTPATWADDDVIAIVDISAQETKKIQLSTFRGAVTGVSTLNASTPLTVDSATGDVTISVAINGGGTINAVFDEDNMASNSPTALATQQSIKAYVDSQVGTVDTLAEILANGNTSGGTNIVVSSGDVITTNTINETTAASGVTIDGVLVKDGQVDGRDVSVDGTKLDTVETSADVTDATNVLAALVGQEVVATGFTGTLDGVLGGGTPAAITGTALTLTTGATVTTVLDEDNMASNSATALATQQSIKAYVDSQVGTVDTLAEVLALGNTTGGTDIAMTGGDKITNFESTGINDDATSTAITINSSGNVGIGTTAPASALTVSDGTASGLTPFGGTDLFLDSSADNYLQFGSGTSSSPAIYFGDSADGDVGGIIYAHTSDAMSFRTNAAERMRIDSSGRVGIGVSTIDSALSTKLHVAGTIRTDTGSVSANPAIVFDHDNFGDADANYIMLDRTSEAMRFSVNASERVRIDSSGNVGIGTSSSANKLEVNGAIVALGAVTAYTNTGLYLQNKGSSVFDVGAWRSGASVAELTFSTDSGSDAAPVERVRIDSSGNVGIGTSSPATKFHVLDGTSSLRFRQNGTVAETLTVGPSGGDAAIYLGDVADTVRAGLFYDTSENDLQIRGYNNSTRIIIDSSGKVGIGTTSPTFNLDVSGGTSTFRLKSTSPLMRLEDSDDGAYHTLIGSSDDLYITADAGNTGAGNMIFRNGGGSERMRITSAGNVGIGDSAPTAMLDVAGDAAFGSVASSAIAGAMVNIRQPMAYDPADGDGTSAINIITQTTIADGSKMGGISWARMTSNGGTTGGSISGIGETTSAVGLAFGTGTSNTERMRITSAGDVGIGTSSPSTLLHLASTGNAILTLEADTDNVTESDNARIELSQDGGGTTGHMGYGSGTNGIDIWNDYNDYVRIGTNNLERLRIVNNGVVRPATDNVQPLGAAANRWSVVYAGTGTINTSDEREKQQIADLDDAERRVAVAIKGLVKKYKYNDAVALKGDDARIHVGVIAQEVIAAFEAEGLDATRYALLCHDTWEAEPEEVDKNGNVINPGIEAGERYGIRYDELLAFMIAAL